MSLLDYLLDRLLMSPLFLWYELAVTTTTLCHVVNQQAEFKILQLILGCEGASGMAEVMGEGWAGGAWRQAESPGRRGEPAGALVQRGLGSAWPQRGPPGSPGRLLWDRQGEHPGAAAWALVPQARASAHAWGPNAGPYAGPYAGSHEAEQEPYAGGWHTGGNGYQQAWPQHLPEQWGGRGEAGGSGGWRRPEQNVRRGWTVQSHPAGHPPHGGGPPSASVQDICAFGRRGDYGDASADTLSCELLGRTRDPDSGMAAHPRDLARNDLDASGHRQLREAEAACGGAEAVHHPTPRLNPDPSGARLREAEEAARAAEAAAAAAQQRAAAAEERAAAEAAHVQELALALTAKDAELAALNRQGPLTNCPIRRATLGSILLRRLGCVHC